MVDEGGCCVQGGAWAPLLDAVGSLKCFLAVCTGELGRCVHRAPWALLAALDPCRAQHCSYSVTHALPQKDAGPPPPGEQPRKPHVVPASLGSFSWPVEVWDLVEG